MLQNFAINFFIVGVSCADDAPFLSTFVYFYGIYVIGIVE